VYNDTDETSITQWQAAIPPRQLSRASKWPAIAIVLGVLAVIAGYAAAHISYAVPGGFDWTASRQLQACDQAIPLTGAFPATAGCAHARELVLAGNVLPVVGVALVVAGIVFVVRGRQRRSAMLRHPSSGAGV
jgi:hypothetical protein